MTVARLVTCPVFALLATFSIATAFICKTAVAMEEAHETEKLTVNLQVFSGTPNPSFDITDPDAIARLRESLKGLPAVPTTEEERFEFSRLGYRGIIITNTSGIEGIPGYVQFFNGKVMVLGARGEAARFFTDTAGLEEYYLRIAEKVLAEAEQLALEQQAMDVGDLLRDAQVKAGPDAADRGVTLALDLPAELPEVMGDRWRISEVLSYLLYDALLHTPEGGRVTLSAAAGKRVVKVTVAATGTEIPPEDLPDFYEQFWRGKNSRSGDGGKTLAGLKLLTAKHLVEMHGGTIGVESTPGEGSKFWFALPVGLSRRY